MTTLFLHKILKFIGIISSLILTSSFFQCQSCLAPLKSIQGFDISHHQGHIHWQQISSSHFQFVYIKATEGTDYIDPLFKENWHQAKKTELKVGAYHFFNICRSGDLQARNFIRTVPKRAVSLAPAIDLEYDTKCIQTLTKDQLLKNIDAMQQQLQKYYAKIPIFYTSPQFYEIILKGNFKNTPIWLRQYNTKPQIKWQYWQYSAQGKIQGIKTPVDLDLYAHSPEYWQKHIKNEP